mmetsp:Transcript_66641/g.188336  ORF Transcript_66641/g.188336 Transcript_66641/m.188336 type:complete len:240 (+) Transcript_66641:2141-2860(+)
MLQERHPHDFRPLRQALHRQGEGRVGEGPRRRLQAAFRGTLRQRCREERGGAGEEGDSALVGFHVSVHHGSELLGNGQDDAPRALRLRFRHRQQVRDNVGPGGGAQMDRDRGQGEHQALPGLLSQRRAAELLQEEGREGLQQGTFSLLIPLRDLLHLVVNGLNREELHGGLRVPKQLLGHRPGQGCLLELAQFGICRLLGLWTLAKVEFQNLLADLSSHGERRPLKIKRHPVLWQEVEP